MLHGILKLFEVGVKQYTRHAAANQDAPNPDMDPALFKRRFKTGADYVRIGVEAFKTGDNLQQVKELLIAKGLNPDHTDMLAEKAEREYKKWRTENPHTPTPSVFDTYAQCAQPNKDVAPGIELLKSDGEDHALHFSAVIGAKRYFHVNGRQILYKIVEQILRTPAVRQNGSISLKQSTFKAFGGAEDNPHIRVVAVNGDREAVYPYLSTENIGSFNTRRIIEWSEDDVTEADVQGLFKSQYKLSFFATDYAINKHIYKSKTDVDIRLSAFLLEVNEPINGPLANPDEPASGYWKNKSLGGDSYYDYQGEIIKIKATPVDTKIIGCIVTLRLIDQSFDRGLIVDAYVTNDNIRATTIKKGMLVCGVLWFQGEIA